ncbi:hypothetical protein BHE74_00032633 [Ensete ventricosum]|nr:hypothetical protein GW17_00061279 [Ensete ventricosum]RWW60376.1 hypothetical protein BHE74_00032633 [Ensete ventricosum]RZR90682.1 hypothetical protein BHM03_00018602 [Ensete ventricosum]
MVANRSESEGSSDGGGRRGQQRCRLRAAVCTAVAEEGSRGIERETTTGRVHFDVGRDQDSWQRKIAAGCDVDRLQRKIAAGSFLPQGSLLAMIKEDGSERSLLAALCSEGCVLRLKG